MAAVSNSGITPAALSSQGSREKQHPPSKTTLPSGRDNGADIASKPKADNGHFRRNSPSEPPRSKRSSRLPADWLHLTPIGAVIEDTRIVCFKTPFNGLKRYPRHRRREAFTVTQLLSEMSKRGIALGLVIDLTDTDRYYEPELLSAVGVKVVKIRVPGKRVPCGTLYHRFLEEIDLFLGTASMNSVVGVHCTHGINRTGWFVCRYLMERKGLTSEAAVRLFSEARGYAIYREYILGDLHGERTTSADIRDAERPAITCEM